MLELVRWILVALAAIALFLSSWTVVSAPIMALLPLAVGAPEISPILLMGNALLLFVSYLFSTQFSLALSHLAPLTWIALGMSGLGLVLSCLPLSQLPATLYQSEQNMQKSLGQGYGDMIPAWQTGPMRSRPFDLLDLVRGISIPTITPETRAVPTPDGDILLVEIYRPPLSDHQSRRHPSNAPHPILVTIYGGAWQSGEPKQKESFNTYMANQGYVVVALDYRHAPDYQFPTQINDVETVLQWIGDQAPEAGWDCHRLALVGWSAGGHLALLAAYRNRISSIQIQAVVNYYGAIDLTAGYLYPPKPDPIDNRAVLETFLGGSPEHYPERYRAASPITYVRPGLPPTFSVYGDRDHLVKPSFGVQLHEQLQASQNNSVLLQLPWAEHAFDAIFSGMGNQIALYHTERFLAWALYPKDHRHSKVHQRLTDVQVQDFSHTPQPQGL